MISEDKMKEILENSESQISEYLIQEAKRDIANKLNYNLETELSEIVKTFISETIAPEIKKTLMDSKPMILKAVVKMSNKMADELSKALLEKFTENLGNSWDRKEIWKALFE